MREAIIIAMNGLFFALFAWFASIHFNDIKADNRELRNQVYNHIPSQIRELKDDIKRLEDKLDRLIERNR